MNGRSSLYQTSSPYLTGTRTLCESGKCHKLTLRHINYHIQVAHGMNTQSRANNLIGAAFNNLLTNGVNSANRFRPFANFLPVQLNPNIPNFLASIDSCTSPSGEFGICAPKAVCSVYGGRPSGSCAGAAVCCISKLFTESAVTLL